MEVKYKIVESQSNFTDHLLEVEMQMEQVWSQYINYLEKNGFDETATEPKSKYMRIYQSYKNNQNWRSVVTSK